GLFIAVKHHYSILSAELYNDIGAVLQNMEVYPNALEYFKKSLSIFEGTDELQALGILNQNIGEVFLAQAQYDRAIAYFTKANAIVKKQNDKDGLSSVYTDLGVCYAHKKQFQKAISYLDTSLAIGKRYKIVYNQAYAEIGFATVYNLQKDYQKAYPHALAAHQLAVKLGNLSIRANAALQLNETLAGLGRVEEAYTSLKEYINLKNGLKDNESIQKLTSYNYNLQFSVRERLLAQEQRNKEQLYKQTVRVQRLTILVFFILVIAMLGTTLIYYSERGKQLKINASLDEQTSKLNDLNKLKDRLIAILAHDLRGPLSTLRGLFDLLQDKTISHEEMLSMLPLVLKKIEHTSDFLDTLLFWINSQMENFESAAKSFSVNEVVVNEVKQHYEQAISKGIIITEHIPLGLTAFADPNCVCIVVRNLITNAIKFCEAGDIIQIAAKQQDHHILISVNDSGGGMTTEQVNKLFRSKVDSQPGTQNERGTGMGLLFCKDLVEKANGKIWVKSEVGIGSKFSFTIPST
ncbi:MAG: sensor histidine kinase, partial [Mucilaginibacter sp.]|nr:sensor histidine kinase [Mucilaginibacter sp.]